MNPTRLALLLVVACSSEPTNDPAVVHSGPVGPDSLVESVLPPDSEVEDTETEPPVESTPSADSDPDGPDTEPPTESESTPDSQPTHTDTERAFESDPPSETDAQPIDTEQAFESDPPSETDAQPTDTEPFSDSDPPRHSTPDSDPGSDTDPPIDTDTAADSPPDTLAAVDSDPSIESDAPPDSDPPADTDPPRDAESTPHSDTSVAPTDSEPDSDSLHTDDSPPLTDSPDDSPDTDQSTTDTDTASLPTDSDDDSPADWPIAPQCTFRTDGVYAPTSQWRSIDFDAYAGSYLTLSNRFVRADNTSPAKIAMLLGNSPSWYWAGVFDTPGAGITFYSDLMTGSIRSPGDQYPVYLSAYGTQDLDGDGASDILYFAREPSRPCRAITGLAGERLATTGEWSFVDSDLSGLLYFCSSGDISGDGNADLHMFFHLPNGASETRWYLGPFPQGVHDLAGTAVVRLALPDRSHGSHALGDYNGDGQVDLALTWWGADRTDGEILIWFGPVSGDLDPNLPDLRIESTAGSGFFASYNVINAGDIDGDGTDDLAFNSTEHRNGYPSSNAVYVFKGPLDPGPGLLDDDADSVITWPATMARTGNYLTPLGDVDGDERDDFSVNVWAGRHRPPDGFPLRPIWPPELVPPEGSDTALPPDTDSDGPVVPVDSWDTGPSRPPAPFNPFPWGVAQGAIMVFGDTPPGEIGPQQAKFTLAGTRPGDWIAQAGVIGPGDLNGDGLADIAYTADPYGTGVRVRVVFPCTDFGVPVVP